MRSHAPSIALALLLATAAVGRGARADDPPPPPEPGYLMFEPWPSVLTNDDWLKKHSLEGHKGVIVWDVAKGGPADQAGVKEGDVVVSVNGEPLPLPANLDASPEERRSSGERFTKGCEDVWAKIHPGAKVTLALERGGKPLTVEVVAVGQAARDKIAAAEEEESSAQEPPDYHSGGVPMPAAFSFERLSADKVRPDAFLSVVGQWEVTEEEGASPANHVLKQSAHVQSTAICLVTGTGRAYGNAVLSARVKVLSGSEDPSGGVVVRAKDRKNFYLARIGANDSSFRLLIVKDGAPKELAAATVVKPGLSAWHTIEVTTTGPKIKATLDGKASIEATEASFAAGWSGLWTRGDSETAFDDVKITPAK